MMEYLDIVNAVMDSHFEAIKYARHKLKQHIRQIELSGNAESETKKIIASLDYDKTIAGSAYINSDYHVGVTHIEVRNTLASFYYHSPIIKRMNNPIEVIREDSRNFYILFLQEIELWKRLIPKGDKPYNKASQYSQELLQLFHNHENLINELIGLDNDSIARKIRQWAKERDNTGKTLIENPGNYLKSKYAKLLIEAGLVTCHEKTFRSKL